MAYNGEIYWTEGVPNLGLPLVWGKRGGKYAKRINWGMRQGMTRRIHFSGTTTTTTTCCEDIAVYDGK